MPYQCAVHTTVPQRINHKNPHAAAECERLEECTTQSAANHDHTGFYKKTLVYVGQTVSVINNDGILWLPATAVCAADHDTYIISSRSRISLRRGCQLPRGCQHTILPNFPKNCMELKEFGPQGGAHPSCPLDLPLIIKVIGQAEYR